MSTDRAEVESMLHRVNELAVLAGLTGGFAADLDAWVFADAGGEIRTYLRMLGDEMVLTEAQRAETVETLVFATPLLSDMEKYLTYSFCEDLRFRMRLPRLLVVSIPVTKDKVAAGYSISKGQGRRNELHHAGEEVVRRGIDNRLVKFSHYADLSPEEIRSSALDPEGRPHFMVSAEDRP